MSIDIYDKLIKYKKDKRIIGPVGWVQVFLDDKLVVNKPNLVVAQGREFVAVKTFEVVETSSGETRPNYGNYKISHFGVGSGGTSVVNNEVIFLGPNVCDNSLYDPISLGVDDSYLIEPSGVAHVLKPITSDGSIYLEQGGLCDLDYYTKVKCTCTLIPGEPVALEPGESVKIDEAGLYFTDGTNAKMFSHICFRPEWKEKESKFVLIWYILY